jgi:hypothetical protein
MEASIRTEFIGTLIIGGGQTGLAMSHMLSQRGCPEYRGAIIPTVLSNNSTVIPQTSISTPTR